MSNNIKIVIGSWGSYNECNERALGSKWLDLSDYSDWDEIVEELKKEMACGEQIRYKTFQLLCFIYYLRI